MLKQQLGDLRKQISCFRKLQSKTTQTRNKCDEPIVPLFASVLINPNISVIKESTNPCPVSERKHKAKVSGRMKWYWGLKTGVTSWKSTRRTVTFRIIYAQGTISQKYTGHTVLFQIHTPQDTSSPKYTGHTVVFYNCFIPKITDTQYFSKNT